MNVRRSFMAGMATWVLRYHRVIAIVGVVLALLSAFAATRIEIKTQLKDMLPADDPKVASLTEISDRFTGSSSVMVLVEGTDKEKMAAAAEDFVHTLRSSADAMAYVRNISMKADVEFLSTWGLMLQEPDDIRTSGRMLRDVNLASYIRSLNGALEEGYTGSDAEQTLETEATELEAAGSLAQIERFAGELTRALTDPGPWKPGALSRVGNELAELALFGEEYSFSPDGSLLALTISPSFPVDDVRSSVALVAEVRRIQQEVGSRRPEVSFGYTGDIASNADEQDAVAADVLYPALAAYALVLLVFLFSFDSIRSIVLTLVTLIAGILYNYGILAVTLGSVNMLTSIMGALLVGMGIDYGIQVTTSFGAFRAEGSSTEEAVRRTFERSGGGILLAAVTTAASFFVFVFSGSKALRQFGFVAGTGIVTCYLSMTLLLPSLLLLSHRSEPRVRRLPRIDYGFLARLGAWSARHRRPVLCAAATVAVLAGLSAVLRTELEYDMMKLQPSAAPSTAGYHTLLDRFGLDANSASISLSSIEEARDLTERLEKLRGVAMVSSVSRYIASDDEQDQRLDAIRDLRSDPPRRAPLLYDAVGLEALEQEILRLEQNVIELGDLSVAGLGEDNRIVGQRNRMVREVLGAEVGRPGNEIFRGLIDAIHADPSRAASVLAEVDRGFGEAAESVGTRLIAADRRLVVDDLPESVIREYFDESRGATLLTVFPSASAVGTSADVLRFARALDDVDERISGMLPLSVAWMAELRREAIKMGIVLALLVAMAMMVGFRKPRLALVAAVPPALGLVGLFGLVGLLRVQFSAANLAVTPMVIGIGIAYGTYMTHRYLIEGGRLGRALAYTTKAVFLSAFTTMAGFGSLWLVGSHAAISSIGAVLFLGITATLVTTLTVLPALLGEARTYDTEVSHGVSGPNSEKQSGGLGDSARSRRVRAE